MLNVAIIGAGHVGRIRATVIQRSPVSRVRIVADVDAALAAELAESIGANATSDWQKAASSPEIDVVLVCTPTKFHPPAAECALQAGKHVLCEKPLARTVEEAEMMVSTAEQADRILKTGFNYRHMAHVRKAKELLDEGVLGPLYFMRCCYGHGGRPGYEKAWCTDLELSGGGVLLEQGIHILDLVRHLLGEPVQVCAEAPRFFWNFPDVEDNCFLLLKTESGQVAHVHVSWTQWVNVLSLEIFGREGYLRLEGRDGHYGRQKLVWGRRQANHSRPEEQRFDFAPPDDSWQVEWEEFMNAIVAHRQPLGNGFDGLRALHLVQASYSSARDHSWIRVPELLQEVSR
jgi:predicted dehydrogenase